MAGKPLVINLWLKFKKAMELQGKENIRLFISKVL